MADSEFLTYKGKPLVRSGNTIYYGNMTDAFVVMLQIQSQGEPLGDLTLADKITIQLLATDPNLNPVEKIIKKSEKNGLYDAMDIASIWLERALKN